MFDYAVIGAGISGASITHFLTQKGQSVALFDDRGIAGGGSGAAGAFVSPKVSHGGELKAIINEAFIYSTQFYSENFPQFFNQTGVVQLPSNTNELNTYATEANNSAKPDLLELVQGDTTHNYEPKAGTVNAKKMCEALAQKATFFNQKINSLLYNDNFWQLDEFQAKHVILTTGAYSNLLGEEYLGIRPVWGQRCDVTTTTKVDVNYHKGVSVAKTDEEGNFAIGATHQRFVLDQPCSDQENEKLIEKAINYLKLENINVVKSYCGARAASNDYVPLVGRVVDSAKTVESYPSLKKGTKIPKENFVYYPNLFMINGLGGRGFVLGPFLADQLLCGQVDGVLDPTRMFVRWVRKQ
jgi:tRNA 5-methylaminomethyl-2-thiouridine biosynthesis bifunctional protein